jgi:hypothetical protein
MSPVQAPIFDLFKAINPTYTLAAFDLTTQAETIPLDHADRATIYLLILKYFCRKNIDL